MKVTSKKQKAKYNHRDENIRYKSGKMYKYTYEPKDTTNVNTTISKKSNVRILTEKSIATTAISSTSFAKSSTASNKDDKIRYDKYNKQNHNNTKLIDGINMNICNINNKEYDDDQDPLHYYEIVLKNFQFHPQNIKIEPRTLITWKIGKNIPNHDTGIYYTNDRKFVIMINGADIDLESDLLSEGQSFQFLFINKGTYDIVCSNYKRIKGTIQVIDKTDIDENGYNLYRNYKDRVFFRKIYDRVPIDKNDQHHHHHGDHDRHGNKHENYNENNNESSYHGQDEPHHKAKKDHHGSNHPVNDSYYERTLKFGVDANNLKQLIGDINNESNPLFEESKETNTPLFSSSNDQINKTEGSKRLSSIEDPDLKIAYKNIADNTSMSSNKNKDESSAEDVIVSNLEHESGVMITNKKTTELDEIPCNELNLDHIEIKDLVDEEKESDSQQNTPQNMTETLIPPPSTKFHLFLKGQKETPEREFAILAFNDMIDMSNGIHDDSSDSGNGTRRTDECNSESFDFEKYETQNGENNVMIEVNKEEKNAAQEDKEILEVRRITEETEALESKKIQVMSDLKDYRGIKEIKFGQEEKCIHKEITIQEETRIPEAKGTQEEKLEELHGDLFLKYIKDYFLENGCTPILRSVILHYDEDKHDALLSFLETSKYFCISYAAQSIYLGFQIAKDFER